MSVETPTFDAPEKYEQYALNVEGHAPEKAQEARRQAVKLRATRDGAQSDVERECLEATDLGAANDSRSGLDSLGRHEKARFAESCKYQLIADR